MPHGAGTDREAIGRRTLIPVISLVLLLLGGGFSAHKLAERREVARERARYAAAARIDNQARSDQLRVWNSVLEADPTSAVARAQLAGLYVQRARESGDEQYYSRAEELARESLALTTGRNAKSYLTLAAALLAQHRFTEARDAAALAVAADSETVSYRALVAELDMELGDYDAAARGFSGLARYRAHLAIAPRLARWAETVGRPEEARRILERAAAEAETRRDMPREQVAWFRFRLGDHLRRHGKPRAARREFRAALAINPGDHRALRAWSELELAAGNGARAERLARAAAARSRTPETLVSLAEVLRARGDSQAADSVRDAVRALLAAEGGAFERAWHLQEMDWGGDVQATLAILEAEIRERPDIHGYDLLGWAYYKSGRIAEASEASRQALRTGTSDAAMWFRAGVIARAAGDPAVAIQRLAHALELNPEFHHSYAAQARGLTRALSGRSMPLTAASTRRAF